MKHHPFGWRQAAGLALVAGLGAAPALAQNAPVMDGVKDTGTTYTLVASSPMDNLVAGDAADPRFKSLDVTNLWAASTGTDLYLYIELPYLDLNTIAGEWGVTFHLKGANDALQSTFASDPYGAAVDFAYASDTSPGVNAELKSNMLGFLRDYDGNQGYAFLLGQNKGLNGWNFSNGQFLTNAGVTVDTANNLVHGFGNSGGEVVYKGSKGIEVKIPLALFGSDPNNSDLVAPSPGDQILMQYYDNVRERTSPNYPRGSVDSVPFEPGTQADPTRGLLTTWASYTLAIPAGLEVGSVSIVDPLILNEAVVSFSEAVGTGATTPGNYTVTNTATGTAIPVTSAAIDPNNAKQVILTLALPYNAAVHITVHGVQAAGGRALSATKNAGDISAYTAVQFNLRDPYGAIAALGTNPDTSQPYKLTVTGDPISYRNSLGGANEIPMNPVAGDAGHYRSPVILAKAGVFQYKYRVPEIPDGGSYDDWNSLNPKDRRAFAPLTSSVVQINDNAAGPYQGVNHYGGMPVQATFTLVDRDNIAAGRPVYVTGDFIGYTADPTVAIPMPAVAGQPNTYSATFNLPDGFGYDTATRYKYIIKPDPINDPNNTLFDILNPFGDRFVLFHNPGNSQPSQVRDDLVGSRLVRILRTAAGLDAAPGFSDYYKDQDVDQSGSVTLADVLKAAHS